MNDIFKDLFIFEMANNHQGSVDHGLIVIEAVADIAEKYGIRAAIKFQYRHLDTFIHPDFKERQGIPHIPRFMETRLTGNDFRTLADAARKRELLPICTPFDEPSVSLIIDHGYEILKIGSPSAKDWPLLEVASRSGLPIICSTGGLATEDIDNLASFFSHHHVEFAFMHCVSLYPTPSDAVHMHYLDRMIHRYPEIPIGYSGHEAPDDLDVVKVAVAKGATILERHVGVPNETITLNQYSMNPEQTEAWIRSALSAKQICGPSPGYKEVTPLETESLRELARGTFALHHIPKGEVISRDSVFFAMPSPVGNTTSGEFKDTMVASREYETGEPIMESRQPDNISIARTVMHTARGMLAEAGVRLGDVTSIELSHHYGLENIWESGAILITLVNREYCKKIIVLLPGQRHPVHYHKIKDETFHLLSGDMELDLDGDVKHMLPGDMSTVSRHVRHGFSSKSGAILEEISTFYIVGDSYYDDEKIARLDPMQRKTIVDYW